MRAAEWRLERRGDLDMYGFTDYEDQAIVLRADLTLEETLCTLAHEITHVERGPAMSDVADLEEKVVDLITTARLVPVGELPGLAKRVAAEGEEAVAALLGVDLYTVGVAVVLSAAVDWMMTEKVGGGVWIPDEVEA